MIPGYREKVFAIIGVKVYAAGLYVNQSILNNLNAWKGRPAAEIQKDPSLFSSMFQCNILKYMHFPCQHTDTRTQRLLTLCLLSQLLLRNHYRLFWLEMLMGKHSGMPWMMPSLQESNHPLLLMSLHCPHFAVPSKGNPLKREHSYFWLGCRLPKCL